MRPGADGAPDALIRPCGDDAYRGPALDGRAGSDAGGLVTTGWDTHGEHTGDAAFPLFMPPARWHARHRGARRLLPDHTYTLSFGHYVTGDSYNGVVTFSAEDFATLRPGQVWADGRATSPRRVREARRGLVLRPAGPGHYSAGSTPARSRP
ncbi:hypothetical protein [Streptomyces sp. NPDC004533]|uniref:hypothetical protein n=1 Tax=Streptomyces sp. NPDC004533 TaxID=3154278 RepID=UPI0033A57018